MSDSPGSEAIREAIESVEGPAVCAYVTAGFPSREAFPEVLESVAATADLVEVGVPFTDPMADGLTIQRASQVALADGTSLEWIFTLLAETTLETPHLLMGYYNPFLAHGLDRLVDSMRRSATSGLIVPDLPIEEAAPLRDSLAESGSALVQLVTPTTPEPRLTDLTRASEGFVYAVTMTGVTGGQVDLTPDDIEYLRKVRRHSRLPVLAGFGIRERSQVEALAPHVDGVVVGSALLDTIARGGDPGEFLTGLRPQEVPA